MYEGLVSQYLELRERHVVVVEGGEEEHVLARDHIVRLEPAHLPTDMSQGMCHRACHTNTDAALITYQLRSAPAISS